LNRLRKKIRVNFLEDISKIKITVKKAVFDRVIVGSDNTNAFFGPFA
jgi:hypothetical protein